MSNYDSKQIINIELQKTLNRSMSSSAFIRNNFIPFSILFHKQTPALQFCVNTKSSLFKDSNISLFMFRNLEKCFFSKLFLKLESESDEDLDYRSRFTGIKEQYSEHIIQFCNEKLDLHSVGVKSFNTLSVYGYKLHGIEDELNYFFVQRRCRNTMTRKDVIRTAAILFSTQEGLSVIEKYQKHYDLKSKTISNSSDIPNLFGE